MRPPAYPSQRGMAAGAWVPAPAPASASRTAGPSRPGSVPTRRLVPWVQVTEIGLDALVDRGQMVAWATALENGAPLAGVELALGGLSATTAEDGIARLDLPDSGAAMLVGRLGNDVALLPQNTYYWDESGGWRSQ